jgi:hypothetical protein
MLKPYVFRKAVTTAGTAERLTKGDIYCSYVRIQAEDDNTGVTFIGASDVSSSRGIELMICAGGDTDARTEGFMELFATRDDLISLKDIWADVATGGDGVIVFCLRKD